MNAFTFEEINPVEFERRFRAGDPTCVLAAMLRQADNDADGTLDHLPPLWKAQPFIIETWYNKARRVQHLLSDQGFIMTLEASAF